MIDSMYNEEIINDSKSFRELKVIMASCQAEILRNLFFNNGVKKDKKEYDIYITNFMNRFIINEPNEVKKMFNELTLTILHHMVNSEYKDI